MALVSVVIIFYNEEKFLTDAITSVLDQTLNDWELVLVDDGSTDSSTSIARDFAALDPRIRYVEHLQRKNCGMPASRNLGARCTDSPYLTFLDGDDRWLPEKLAQQTQILESLPDVAMVNGAINHWVSWNSNFAGLDEVVLTGGLSDQRLDPPHSALTLQPLGRSHPAGIDLMIRRSVFEEVGGFDEKFKIGDDQSLLFKVFLNHSVYFSSHCWLLYRQHAASVGAKCDRASDLIWIGEFLDWLEVQVGPVGDHRINCAVERARRRLRHKKMTAPLRAVLDFLIAHSPDFLYKYLLLRLPSKYKGPVKLALRQRVYAR